MENKYLDDTGLGVLVNNFKKSIKTVNDNIPAIDSTLTLSGKCADSKVVGDKIRELKNNEKTITVENGTLTII